MATSFYGHTSTTSILDRILTSLQEVQDFSETATQAKTDTETARDVTLGYRDQALTYRDDALAAKTTVEAAVDEVVPILGFRTVITGDGVQDSYTFTHTPNTVYEVFVSIGGIVQTPGEAFTLAGKTITFTEPFPQGAKVFIAAATDIALPGVDAAAVAFEGGRFDGKSLPDAIEQHSPAPLATRADLVSKVAGGWVPEVGHVEFSGGVGYLYDGVGTDISDLPGWIWDNRNTPKHHGAVGDYTTDDTAALKEWLASFGGEPLWIDSGIYRVTDTLALPEGVMIDGLGGSVLSGYQQYGFEKDKMRPGYKHTLSGANIIFDGSPETVAYSTGRSDRFASVKPCMSYLHTAPHRVRGFSVIQDMDIRDANNNLTTAATDNRSTGYTVGYLNVGYNARINLCVFGYFGVAGFVQLAKPGDGIGDPDYTSIGGSEITGGVAVIGADAGPDGGLTGFKTDGANIVGADHHNRDDTDPNIPVFYADGDTGGSNSGIRGIVIFGGSLRGYANNAIVLDNVDDFSMIGVTTEFSHRTGITGLDTSGIITGTDQTGNVTLMGVAATGDLGLHNFAVSIGGNFTFAQAGQYDMFTAGTGGAGVSSNLAFVRMNGTGGDSVIQLGDNLTSSVQGWTIRRDLSDSEELEFRWDNASYLRLDTSGHVYMTLPTYADNASAQAGGVPFGAEYKTSTGERRVRV